MQKDRTGFLHRTQAVRSRTSIWSIT